MQTATAESVKIKASEVRIGNWVNYFGKPYRVKQIKHENSSFYIAGVKNMGDLTAVYNVVDSFTPIPLTPELLEKCGFEKVSEGLFTAEPFALTQLSTGGFFFSVWGKDLCIVWYLHRLQNLIFEIESKELQINL